MLIELLCAVIVFILFITAITGLHTTIAEINSEVATHLEGLQHVIEAMERSKIPVTTYQDDSKQVVTANLSLPIVSHHSCPFHLASSCEIGIGKVFNQRCHVAEISCGKKKNRHSVIRLIGG